jgi:hypothetical protein
VQRKAAPPADRRRETAAATVTGHFAEVSVHRSGMANWRRQSGDHGPQFGERRTTVGIRLLDGWAVVARKPVRVHSSCAGMFLQVNRQGNYQAPAKCKVAVCEWRDGRVEIRYRGRRWCGRRLPSGCNGWIHRDRWPLLTVALHRRRATHGNSVTTGCRCKVGRSGRSAVRKLF